MITHLARGLAILGERWWSGPWIAEGKTALDRNVRRGLRALLTVAVFRVACASRWLFLLAILVVIVRALRAATKAAKGTLKAPAKTASTVPNEDGEEWDEDYFVPIIWDTLDGSPAVHLTTLARGLAQHTGLAWDPDQVRAHCKTLDIPIRPKVRDLGGDRVSSGVHRDDLPPLPQPLSEGATEPVAAATPQVSAATPGGNATAPTRTVRRVGDLRITAIDDPDNPARTHVRIADPTRKRARS